MLLPNKHRFTELLIRQEHARLMHSGVQATLAELRSKVWICCGRQAVKRVIGHCFVCKRARCPSGQQVEAPLPANRISESPPFQDSGVDFAGPLYVRSSAKRRKKAYIALFTCAVTRAVHLELVSDLTTECFLLSLRRFFARRGVSKTMYSDNAKTFKRSKDELAECWKAISDPDALAFYGRNGVVWKFNVAKAPWWGGFWERLVRSVKECLRRTLGNACLSFEELATVLTEIEAILNSRPLSYVYSHPGEEEALTPAHFLVGKRLTTMPTHSKGALPKVDDKDLGRRWQYRNRLLNNFWTRWRKDYLLDLRNAREVKNVGTHSIWRKDDVVIVSDEKLPRHRWKLGRICDVFLGRDGKVRSCMVKTTTGATLRRPVQLLYPLEI